MIKMFDYFNPRTAGILPADRYCTMNHDQSLVNGETWKSRGEPPIYLVPPKDWDTATIRENTVYATGDLLIDRPGKMIYKNHAPLDLTPTEYEVVIFLVENATMFCSRSSMRSMINLRFRHRIADNTLSKHIHRARGKLGQNNGGLNYVVTRNSRGYKWNLPVYKCYLDRTK